jgi:hypothetical protein
MTFSRASGSAASRSTQATSCARRTVHRHAGRARAINLASGMQIVPGAGVPFVRSGGRTEHDLFLYLSVEHSFR